MRKPFVALVLLTGWGVVWMLGCGGNSDTKKAERVAAPEGETETAKNSKDEIKHYIITDLPPVDEPLQRPLDGGRLEICPPADWAFSSQPNYLVVFAKGKVSQLPRMTVGVIESPHGTENTTEENAKVLAEAIRKKLAKEKRNVREPPKPLKLGESVWIRHVRQAPQGGSPCAVQSLQTIRGGRLYTLEMFSAAKDDSQAAMAAAVNVSDVRKISYAVAANARFPKETGGSPEPVKTPDEKSPETKPETKTESPAPETKPAPPAAEKPAEKKEV